MCCRLVGVRRSSAKVPRSPNIPRQYGDTVRRSQQRRRTRLLSRTSGRSAPTDAGQLSGMCTAAGAAGPVLRLLLLRCWCRPSFLLFACTM